MLDWNNPSQFAANRSQIIKTLREVVKRVVYEFKLSLSPLNPCERTNVDGVVEAVPVSFRPPSTSMDMILPQKRRVTTLLVGENLVSFELPYDCPFHPEDLEELVEVEKNEAMAQNKNGEIIFSVPRYTFLQRLQGWKMERRQRINGRFDMYYHHLRSRKVFRSVAEVVNFFMYEVYPDKPSTKSNLGQLHFPGFKREKQQRGVRPLKRKIEEYETKKLRGKWVPVVLESKYNNNGDNKKGNDDHHHTPMFDLNDDHQKEGEEEEEEEEYNDEEDLMYDVVGDNYYNQDNEACDEKETVENFLAESYNNLMNLPNANDDTKKSKSFSFDINERICEEDDDDDAANNQTVEEFMAKTYDNLMNCHKTQPTSQKGKEKRSSSSIEKPRRKKVKTSTPTSFPSFPNTPININSIPSEKITKTVEFMEVPKTASITNVNQNHFSFKEVDTSANHFIFTDICESSAAAAMKATGGGEWGSSSASFHMDEYDLINHIPQSRDMFDLAMFLAKNRGANNGGF